MDLALFDLDRTLIDTDSDYEWGRYLCHIGAVDRTTYEATNQQFYADYCAGTLDIRAYLRFALQPLTQHGLKQLQTWRKDFINDVIAPTIRPSGQAAVREHQSKGDMVIIVSSTNRFIVEPIAARLGIDTVIATELAQDDGQFTGEVAGTPCFREGKLQCLKQWLAEHQPQYQASWFYSDSSNDLSTLEWADHPVVVSGDADLVAHAQQKAWTIVQW